jgi:hypothetical protein
MIKYTHPIKLDICDTQEHLGTLELIDHQTTSGSENQYSDWELRIVLDEPFIGPIPTNNVLIAKYTEKHDVWKLVEVLRDPQEAYRLEDMLNESLNVSLSDLYYCGHNVELHRYSNGYECLFYCEYHGIFFVVNTKELKDCFPEILTRKAINAL